MSPLPPLPTRYPDPSLVVSSVEPIPYWTCHFSFSENVHESAQLIDLHEALVIHLRRIQTAAQDTQSRIS